MSSAGAPTGRLFHTAVSTGTQMIVWGGVSGFTPLDDGARYSPASNAWIGAVQPSANPGGLHHHPAVSRPPAPTMRLQSSPCAARSSA
jgi:hypothetical protein